MKKKHKKKKPSDPRKKNLRRLPSSIVTAQTEYHLYRICAVNGWPERDVGRAIDFVTSEFCKSRRTLNTTPERSFYG